MNTTTQLEDFLGSWTNIQRQYWDNFFQSKPEMTATSEWESACKKPLKITQEMLKSMLQTQAKFTHDLIRNANPELSESGITDQYFDAMQELIDTGFKSQQNLLENWFSFAREFEQQTAFSPLIQWNPIQQLNPVTNWSSAMGNVFQAWGNAVDKTLKAQKEFVSHLTPIETQKHKGTRKSGARTKKSAMGEDPGHRSAA